MGLIASVVAFVIGLLVESIATPLDVVGGDATAFRLRRWADNAANGVARVENDINSSFDETVADLTAPLGGPLRTMARALRGLEVQLYNTADAGIALARFLDPTIREFENTMIVADIPFGPTIQFGFGWLAELLRIPDLFFGFFGRIWHSTFNIPAGVASTFRRLFEFFAQLAPIEVAAGFIGGMILLIAASVAVPTLVGGAVEFTFRSLSSIVRSMLSFLGLDVERKRPTSKVLSMATKGLISNLTILLIMLGVGLSLVTYPFSNVVGVLLLFSLTFLFIVVGELENQVNLYQYALVISPIAVPTFFMQLGFGLTGALVLYALTMFVAIRGASYVEVNSPRLAAEEPIGGGN